MSATMTLSLDDNPPVTVSEWQTAGPQIEYVRSLNAVLPDPSWSHADRSGHRHQWADTRREVLGKPDALPTLVASQQHVPCDGTCGNFDCDGYTVTVWHCALCGEQVEPGYIPDWEAQASGIPIVVGPPEFTLVLDQAPLPGSALQPSRDAHRAVLRLGDAQAMRGRAWIGEVKRGSDGQRWEIHFMSDGRPDPSNRPGYRAEWASEL